MPNSDSQDAREHYENRLTVLGHEAEILNASMRLFSRARGVAFLVFVFLLLCAWSQAAPAVFCYWAAAATFVVFVVLVSCFDSKTAQRDIVGMRQDYHTQQLARLDRDWPALPVDDIVVAKDVAALSRDLDLFGQTSLYQLVAEAHTPKGRDVLANWLAKPAEPEEVARRQAAVRWLAGRSAMREELAIAARALDVAGARPDVFREWGASAGWLADRPHVLWTARGLGAVIVMIPLLVLLQILPAVSILGVYGLVVVSLLFNGFYLGTVHDVFNKVTVGRYELEHYRRLFQTVWDLPPEVERFATMRQRLEESGGDFSAALSQLRRLVIFSSGRRAGALSLLYLIGQLLTLWDFHMLQLLERWQRQHGESLNGWFESVGELEALASFGAVAHNHPEWTYPEIDNQNESSVLEGTALGHPLLPVNQCVRNDVNVGPPGEFLLVTGSNMSGKSTLLRAIGLNSVLAQSGCVACAAQLRLMPLQLATSMRIDDSLADGVSFFMAELKRLKEIVDLASDCRSDNDHQLLFLLDEILQGTNSRERHLAVERILGHLVEMGANGAVSTHDLELASSPTLGAVSKTVHFRERFESGDDAKSMEFDYQLRTGVCPTTNALKLMELVGLE